MHKTGEFSLKATGKPEKWDKLKKIWQGAGVEMDKVTFVTMGQETGGSGTVISEEMRIQEALMEDIEDGLDFEQMAEQNADEAWRVIDVNLAWIEERGLYRKAEWGTKRYQRWMVKLMRRELNALRGELSETKAGKKVLESLRKCYADQSADLGPLRDEITREGITPEEKRVVEQELTEKHLIFRARFQECFNKVTALKIPVGQQLVELYFGKLPGDKVSSFCLDNMGRTGLTLVCSPRNGSGGSDIPSCASDSSMHSYNRVHKMTG